MPRGDTPAACHHSGSYTAIIDNHPPLQTKGMGELPTVAAPAAMAYAVFDAIAMVGSIRPDTPLTSETIWWALHPSKPILL